MKNFTKSLSFKLTLCILLSTIIILSIWSYLNIKLYRGELEKLTKHNARGCSEKILRSTRYSMLKNDREHLREIIETIGGHPSIHRIRIINKKGKITFSTDPSEENTFVDKDAEACYGCHYRDEPLKKLDTTDKIREFRLKKGNSRILGFINPIKNEPQCYESKCHAHSKDKNVLGVLDVQMRMKKIDKSIRASENLIITTDIFAVLIVSLICGLFIWIMVHNPVKKLTEGTKKIGSGELEHKIEIESNDEIGELARSFNIMTEDLKNAREEITEWADTLEKRVEEKREKLEMAHQQMLHSEKMASIGKLAAIVAHEINNPLAGIRTFAKLLQKRVKKLSLPDNKKDKTLETLKTIEKESGRCGEIVNNLLEFSRQSSPDMKENDLEKIIDESLRLIEHKLEMMDCKKIKSLDPEVPQIECDSQQIKQALVAILINAGEAIEDEKGKIEVKTKFKQSENSVLIEISDNGIGMDESTVENIFEPFFTTKDKDGIGLGLAVVYDIIQNHNGSIEVDSEPGVGTTFIITLPVEHEYDEDSEYF